MSSERYSTGATSGQHAQQGREALREGGGVDQVTRDGKARVESTMKEFLQKDLRVCFGIYTM